MPLAPMPKPLSVEPVNVPLTANTSPVSSTFNVVVPPPVMVNAPLMLVRTPPAVGIVLPMLTVFVPAPVLTTIVPFIP